MFNTCEWDGQKYLSKKRGNTTRDLFSSHSFCPMWLILKSGRISVPVGVVSSQQGSIICSRLAIRGQMNFRHVWNFEQSHDQNPKRLSSHFWAHMRRRRLRNGFFFFIEVSAHGLAQHSVSTVASCLRALKWILNENFEFPQWGLIKYYLNYR